MAEDAGGEAFLPVFFLVRAGFGVAVVAVQPFELFGVHGDGKRVGIRVAVQRAGFEYPQQRLAVAVEQFAKQGQVAVAVVNVLGAGCVG